MTRNPRPLDAAGRHRITRTSRPPEGRRPPAPATVAGAVVGLQVVVLLAAMAIEPTATDATVAWAWVGELLALGYLGALGVALASVTGASAVSLRASMAAGTLGLALTVGCPVTGHHTLAPWWFAQLALFATAAAAPLVGRRILR